MSDDQNSIRPFYAGWDVYNQQIVAVVDAMSDRELALKPAENRWPLWATVGHLALARVYWLCGVLGEPGVETTPFPDAVTGYGWEDDLSHHRNASELVEALESLWTIVDGCLDSWTVSMLADEVNRPGTSQTHSRQSVLIRLLAHDAYHCGELSQTLGVEGLPQIDLWPPPRRT